MAYDLWSGKQTARDWSISTAGDWSTDRAMSQLNHRIPWVPIGIGLAAAGVLIFLPSGKPAHAHATSTGSYPRSRRVTSPTMKIPTMSNEEMGRLDPEGVYGRRRG